MCMLPIQFHLISFHGNGRGNIVFVSQIVMAILTKKLNCEEECLTCFLPFLLVNFKAYCVEQYTLQIHHISSVGSLLILK